jgi:pimeloyl-ACP methyl ester carboxylesterase
VPTVTNGAAELAYDARSSGPPVVLLHAGVTDRRSWIPLADRLDARYRSIAYDRRGFGETRYEPEEHDPVADALAVLDAEAVDRAILIAASNGGQRAIDLTLAHPDRVAALVLIAAGARGGPADDPTAFSEPVQSLWAAYEAAEEGDDLDELNRIEAHAWLDGWAADEGRVQGPVRDLFLDMNGIALRSPDPGPEVPHPPAWELVGRIAVPTLVLVGDLDVVCHEASAHFARTIPDVRHEVLAGTGHLPHLEGHERCLDAIVELLDQVT